MNEKNLTVVLVSLFFLCGCQLYGDGQNECVVRGGLPNLFAKLSAGEDVTIAYFGGSITAQPGYRSQTYQWFKDTWPNVKFTQVDAAIGGTGSLLGAFRLQKDVLVHKPDLIFIEFGVNDYSAAHKSADEVVASVEGIVRQVIGHNPNTDMCFVYTITETMLDDLKSGKKLPSIIAHQKVAEHYGLPSVNVGITVAELEKKGKLIIKGPEGKLEAISGESLNIAAEVPVNDKGQIVFSKDGVHPYPNSGHKVYTDAIVNAMLVLKNTRKGKEHRLISPLNDKNLEKAKMVSLSQVKLAGDWEKYDWDSSLLSMGLKKRISDVRVANTPGDSIAFKFTGTVAGYYDIMGPAAGVIEEDINGKKSYIGRFDKYCTYYRISSRTINVADGVHSVKFTLTDRDIDKETLLKLRGSVMDDPGRFADKRWYVGSVMLLGDIIPQDKEGDTSSNGAATSENDESKVSLRRQIDEDFSSWQFGLFMHFNMGTFAGLEWANGYEDPKIFAPAKLDCGQWADAAEAAGIKYGILTAKHTGGWCLWPSAYTRHGVQSFSNFRQGKGDIVREFMDAFRARGLKVGLYYCFPGNYAGDPRFSKPVPDGKPDLHGLPPEAAGDYTGFIKKQLAELLTEYQPDLLWIDQFGNKYTGKDWQDIKAYIHELAPGCIIVGNNAKKFKHSDVISYEWPLDPTGRASKKHGLPGHVGMVPPEGNADWAEVCDTIQTKARWFWHRGLGEADLQSADRMAETYRLCRSRNSNYLLNVPPDSDGLIDAEYIRRLKKIVTAK